mmetsp:Transcript_13665/g.33637  ORF Transcript_13665/g.33637 Transcript_13665/m.33637 type:complete len:212 (-) Transcript_13665:515-1150(-)
MQLFLLGQRGGGRIVRNRRCVVQLRLVLRGGWAGPWGRCRGAEWGQIVDNVLHLERRRQVGRKLGELYHWRCLGGSGNILFSPHLHEFVGFENRKKRAEWVGHQRKVGFPQEVFVAVGQLWVLAYADPRLVDAGRAHPARQNTTLLQQRDREKWAPTAVEQRRVEREVAKLPPHRVLVVGVGFQGGKHRTRVWVVLCAGVGVAPRWDRHRR